MKLSEITYKRFDLEGAKQKYAEITDKFDKAEDIQTQLNAYNEFIGIFKNYSTCESLSYIRFTLNTEDELYSKETDFYDETSPIVTKMYTEFAKHMLNSKFRKELEAALSPLIFTNYEIARKAFDERILEDVQEENRLTTEYKKLLSSAQIPFRGEVLNISQIGKYKESVDRETRREAFNAHGAFMKENSEKFDNIFDKLVKVRDRMAKKMGYKNYVELGYYRMGRNCYSPKDIEAFREQVIKDWVPFVNKMKKAQAAELGIDKIMLYDDTICLKNGNPEPVGTVDEIFNNGKCMYEEMSKETGEFINFMLEHELFDVIARKGKSVGGYCTELADYKMPFIFANFNGTYGDVDVLTHEAGHALASYKAMKNIPLYELNQGGMETCEVHSMSMEFFAWKWMDLFFKEKASNYRFMHISNAIYFIPYGTMVDYFQQCVYEKPEMNPSDRKALWLKLESIFRPYMGQEGITYMEEGGRWQYQSHIYERPFYYIDYCLAQTIAMNFLIAMNNDYDNAFKKYDAFISKGGSQTYVELVKEAGFNLPFEKGALSQLIKSLQVFF